MWFANAPECSEKDVCQSVCVGCLMETPSNWRLVLMPNVTPDPSSWVWYGNGPAAGAFPGGAAKEAHHVLVGNYGILAYDYSIR